MAGSRALFMVVFVLAVAFHSSMVNANFPKSMYFNWGAQHSSILGKGDDLRLFLEKTSGYGIQSKRAFLFGSLEMLIKLVPGNSVRAVTAYYMVLIAVQNSRQRKSFVTHVLLFKVTHLLIFKVTLVFSNLMLVDIAIEDVEEKQMHDTMLENYMGSFLRSLSPLEEQVVVRRMKILLIGVLLDDVLGRERRLPQKMRT
ncbi:beta-glucanase [Artemisia annua]|uniref:Beta-glucanase n=1 Tax=Artemisia annua TaxID=35608 RepID=A0A2U1PY94_ARTAN|nr:beta-glucanase [Artemisia annua]